MNKGGAVSHGARGAAQGRPATLAAPLLQRQCACGGKPGPSGECEECRKKRLGLQRQAEGAGGPAVAPPVVHRVLGAAGRPLDPDVRAAMEERLGHDFSAVRVHTGGEAEASARTVAAAAYTVGRSVVFAQGRYAPRTGPGSRLLAHELTHVVQQGLRTEIPAELAVAPPGGGAEAAAEAAARRAVGQDAEGGPPSLAHSPPGLGSSPGLALQRAIPESGEVGPGRRRPFESETPGEPPRGGRRRGTLPYREATEFAECMRFFAQATAPAVCQPDRSLGWNDFTATPPASSPHSAWTRPDLRLVSFSLPADICAHEVLGEPMPARQQIQAFLDTSASWVKPAVKHASDPAQNGCNQKVAQCQQHFNAAPAGSTGNTFQLSVPGGCAAAAPAPSEVATSHAECSSLLGPACTRREEAESQRLLRHEQLHFDFGCLLARKANEALARGGNAQQLLNAARTKLQPLHDAYDGDTDHGCIAATQATWEERVRQGLPQVTVP